MQRRSETCRKRCSAFVSLMPRRKRILRGAFRPVKTAQDLSGQMFRYEKVELKGASTLIAAANGDPLVTVNKVGKGSVVFSALPDLLGIDERVTPFAAHMLAHVFADATPVQVARRRRTPDQSHG